MSPLCTSCILAQSTIVRRCPHQSGELSASASIYKRASNYEMTEGELFKTTLGPTGVRRRVPRPEERSAVVMQCHDDMGHQGVNKTYKTMQARYHWANMLSDVRQHIRSCSTCREQRMMLIKQNVLKPLPIVAIWHRVHIDCMGPYPVTAAGNKYIVLAVDSFSKWPEARAIPDHSSRTIANFIEEELLSRFGCMRELCSDRGLEFKGPEVTNLLKRNNIQQCFTAGYKPNSNGQAERIVGVIRGMLVKAIANSNTNTWDLHLHSSLKAYRTSPSSTTRFSPAYAMFGREMLMPNELSVPTAGYDLTDQLSDDEDPVSMREGLNVRAARMNQMASALVTNTEQAKDTDRQAYTKRKLDSAPVGGRKAPRVTSAPLPSAVHSLQQLTNSSTACNSGSQPVASPFASMPSPIHFHDSMDDSDNEPIGHMQARLSEDPAKFPTSLSDPGAAATGDEQHESETEDPFAHLPQCVLCHMSYGHRSSGVVPQTACLSSRRQDRGPLLFRLLQQGWHLRTARRWQGQQVPNRS